MLSVNGFTYNEFAFSDAGLFANGVAWKHFHEPIKIGVEIMNSTSTPLVSYLARRDLCGTFGEYDIEAIRKIIARSKCQRDDGEIINRKSGYSQSI